MKLFLDIETLPAAGDKLELLKKLWEETSRKSTKEKISFDDYFRLTSLSGEFGRIFCIGYATDDKPTDCVSGEEREILIKFWELAKNADLFIGHNIIDFDLRFIYKRSIILGVKPSKDLSFARYRNNPIFDTMKEWEKWSNGCTSLHKLSLILGIASPKEQGIDGGKVYDYFLSGKGDEIIEYCKRDVEATRAVYEKITFNN
ncbi:MAG: ribonuclease H-like domain-containing protein [Patescibacteria group bacterium]